MLRVLTLSTLFPNGAEPVLGPFVERQTLGLAARPDVALEVVAPIGLPLWPLSLHPHYAARSRLPLEEDYKGLRVHRPRYTVWPKLAESRTPAAIAAALLPLLRRIRERFPFDVIDAEFFCRRAAAAALAHPGRAFCSARIGPSPVGARADTHPCDRVGRAADGPARRQRGMKRA